jgi:hypothetical protein
MFRPRPEEHFIDAGHVYCPVRKCDVELDVCAGCRWTTSIDLAAKLPVVRCAPQSPPQWLTRPWL